MIFAFQNVNPERGRKLLETFSDFLAKFFLISEREPRKGTGSRKLFDLDLHTSKRGVGAYDHEVCHEGNQHGRQSEGGKRRV